MSSVFHNNDANLVLKMIGPNLKNEMTKIYGDEETLFFNIIEFFNSKYEEDEIQKSATDRIMNRDDLESLLYSIRILSYRKFQNMKHLVRHF